MADFYTFDQLENWHEIAPSISPPARYAVIGDPIAHSKSPQMHNPALRACGTDAQYIRVQVPVGQVRRAFDLFVQHGFRGVNITIPHKQEAMAAVQELDPLARQLGAVNTLVIRDGTFHGYNTDGPGFLRGVRETFGVEVKDLRILVLGAAGGTGRAIVMQCLLSGCKKLYYTNRSVDRALELTKEIHAFQTAHGTTFRTKRTYWRPESIRSAIKYVDLIINATSLGMKDEDELPIPVYACTPKHMIYDMVYRAGSETALIAEAKASGSKYADGMTQLLHQGAIAFEHWFPGTTAPIEQMRAGLATAA